MQESKYEAQKKYLDKQKQLRVWLSSEKYERFKNAATQNNTSIHALINNYIDDYLAKAEGN